MSRPPGAPDPPPRPPAGSNRSAKSGQYVTPAEALAHPDTTVHETHRTAPSAADVGKRLAGYVDKANGSDLPEAYSQDPGFWDVEGAQFILWVTGT